MKTVNILIYISVLIGISGNAQHIRWNNEGSDTLKINELLMSSASIHDPQERIASLAQRFIDTPYVGGTLESTPKESGPAPKESQSLPTESGSVPKGSGPVSKGSESAFKESGYATTESGYAITESATGNSGEILTVNINEVDCTTLIDYLSALALTGGEHRTSWRDFTYNLERMRYRGGEIKGYPSRLHYISDWIVDNTHRGNLEEVTGRCDLATYEVKSLNFMSVNRNLYPALADSANFAAIKETESGYRNHRYPIIKTSRVGNAAKTFLRTGDIVALCTNKKGLDVSHMGILFIDEKKVPYLLHASSKAGKVILDTTPLDQYLTKNRLAGIRVIRLKE